MIDGVISAFASVVMFFTVISFPDSVLTFQPPFGALPTTFTLTSLRPTLIVPRVPTLMFSFIFVLSFRLTPSGALTGHMMP